MSKFHNQVNCLACAGKAAKRIAEIRTEASKKIRETGEHQSGLASVTCFNTILHSIFLTRAKPVTWSSFTQDTDEDFGRPATGDGKRK